MMPGNDPHGPSVPSVHADSRPEGVPFTVRHVTQLVLKLPFGALLGVVVGAISLVGGLFGAGYHAATYFHDPSAVEHTLLSQKDALQAQADKYRELASERLHQVESLSAKQSALAERFDQFVQDTGKVLAAMKDETAATIEHLGAAVRERDQTLQQRDQSIAGLNQALSARAQEIQRLGESLKERDLALQQRDQSIAGLNQSLSARDQALQQRDQSIAGLNQSLSARGLEVQRANEILKERDLALQQRDQSIAGLKKALSDRGEEVQRLTSLLREKDDAIRQRDQTISGLSAKAEAASASK